MKSFPLVRSLVATALLASTVVTTTHIPAAHADSGLVAIASDVADLVRNLPRGTWRTIRDTGDAIRRGDNNWTTYAGAASGLTALAMQTSRSSPELASGMLVGSMGLLGYALYLLSNGSSSGTARGDDMVVISTDIDRHLRDTIRGGGLGGLRGDRDRRSNPSPRVHAMEADGSNVNRTSETATWAVPMDRRFIREMGALPLGADGVASRH